MYEPSKEELKIQIMQEFRNQLVNFLDELIEQFPRETDFVIIRIFIKDQIPMSDVLGRFIRDLLPLKQQVKNRNESFFIENTILYSGGNLSKDKINHFKKLWVSDQLDNNDREIIWTWMDVFIKIADSYYQNFGCIKGWEMN